MKDDEIRKVVRDGYAKVAKKEGSCCAPSVSCCGDEDAAQIISKNIGYSEDELTTLPDGANLGLGCGNPVALASLKEGETVLDLGSGAGIDCFLAAQRVGKNGKVVGVDMTPEMLETARENAAKSGFDNVEFRQGEIENMPVEDSSVDAVISNCVINLSPDKVAVFREAHRVLKPRGRLMISDVVVTKELPEAIMGSIDAYIGCLSGAMVKDEYLGLIEKAGFEDVEVMEETTFPVDLMANDPSAQAIIGDLKVTEEMVKEIEGSIRSIKVKGVKGP
jgi:SAM-dependent methyltransferase